MQWSAQLPTRVTRAVAILLPFVLVWCGIAYYATGHKDSNTLAELSRAALQRSVPGNYSIRNVSEHGDSGFGGYAGHGNLSITPPENVSVQDLSQLSVADALQTSGGDDSKNARPYVSTSETMAPRVAICLVGGARAFEQTGLSIRTHLLGAYNNSDVFFNVPLTENAHKLTVIKGIPNLATVRVFPQKPLDIRPHATAVLTSGGSPNGHQGLVQYFEMVEGCLDLIEAHAKLRNVSYDWVFRTRVDTFWNGPPPPLSDLEHDRYTVPHGSDYFGFNDRAGMGSMASSFVALRRLTCLPDLHQRNGRGFNSESAFKAQMDGGNIHVVRKNFNFCVLTQRIYGSGLPHPKTVPVVSIASGGSLNGAKCRVCKPIAVGEQAKGIADRLKRSHGWFGSASEPQFCDGSEDPNHEGWEAEFDQAAGPAAAAIRKELGNRSRSECELSYNLLLATATAYNGPPADLVCQLGGWGKIALIGEKREWPILWPSLPKKSVVYSLGRRGVDDCFWGLEVAKRSEGEVYLFNVTEAGGEDPAGIEFDAGLNLHLSVIAKVGTEGGEAQSFPPPQASGQLDFKSLGTAMHAFGHEHIHILKIDVGKSDEAIFFGWTVNSPSICQIVMEFSLPLANEIIQSRSFETLGKIGYTFVRCVGTFDDQKCLFVSAQNCK